MKEIWLRDWKWFVALALAIWLPSVLLASMANSKAATEAFKIWGIQSYTGTDHPFIASNETKKIGFMSPGCQDEITIVGKGSNTWDAAFASLPADKGIGATVRGQYEFTIQMPGTTTPPAVVSIPVPGVTTSIQVLIDNVPLNTPVPTGAAEPWTVTIPWDTTKNTDGPHVACVLAFHADGSFQRSPATMLLVKQTP